MKQHDWDFLSIINIYTCPQLAYDLKYLEFLTQ